MGAGALCLCLMLALTTSTVHSHHVALFPSNFRPGWEFTGLVTVLNSKNGNSVTVRADIMDAKNISITSSTQTIADGATSLLRMIVPQTVPQSDKYNLKLEGSGGLAFESLSPLTLERTTTVTLVQTDKSIYKPLDLVRFRIVTVDHELKPQKVPRTITIKNPSGSRIFKFIDDGSRAVFEDTYQLSQFPNLGKWHVEVVNTEKKINVEFPFEVDEYVLPKFEVTATVAPGYLLRKEGANTKVNVMVKAKYTYGKGVTGSVKVKSLRATEDGKIEDGSKMMMIDLDKDLNDKTRYVDNIDVTVEVKDSTDRMYSTVVKVKVVDQPVVVTFDDKMSDKVFRSGTKPRLGVKVTDPLGNALGADVPGDLVVMLKDRQTDVENTVFPLTPGQMYYSHTFSPVTSMSSSLSAEAILTNTETNERFTAYHYLSRFQTMENTTLNLYMKQEEQPVMYEDLKLQVDTFPTNGFRTLRYLVVSRGSVQGEGSVTPNAPFMVTMAPHMCPEVDIIVYGLTTAATPEIIADHQKFTLTGCSEKELTPRVSKDTLRTGSEAQIRMDISWTDKNKNANVGQHDVYMVAVDKSILLLQGNGNDLNPARVDQGLSNFTLGSGKESGGGGGPVPMDVRPGIWPPPSESATTTTGGLFQMRGLVVISDVTMKPPERFLEDGVVFAEMAGAGGGGILRKKGKEPGSNNEESADMAAKTTTVRKDFPDTWIWKMGVTDDFGQLSTVEKVPDTITSWVISGFAVRDDDQLVVTRDPFELAAFNLFFVDINLPYSIRRDEIFIMLCTLFNYDNKDLTGTITLDPSEDFVINGASSKSFMVKKDGSASVKFNITAMTVKTINITVTASDDKRLYSDQVTRTLIVKPEGEPRSNAVTLPVVLTQNEPVFEREVGIDFSPFTADQVVPQSKRLEVQVTGDMMGAALDNVAHLVTQPFGCGEQTMITTLPNIFIMKYLLSIGETTVKFNKTAKAYMTQGWTKETQEYRHKEKGYSAFGERDEAPSTWLTALVVRSFTMAHTYIPDKVDLDLLGEDANYILGLWSTSANGTKFFAERGQVYHDEMQGGTGGGDAMTVFVTVCLIEAEMAGMQIKPEYQGVMDAAFTTVKETAQKVLRLAPTVDEMDKKEMNKNRFLAAITAYALTLRNPVNTTAITQLINFINATGAPWREEEKKNEGGGEGGLVPEPRRMILPHKKPKASAIEITSYCILAYLGMGPQGVVPARELVMWMQSKQNSRGGFSSTLDTNLALNAISAYASVFTKAANSRVEITDPNSPGETHTIDINNDNKRMLQTVQLPPDTTEVKVKVTGSTETFTMVKVAWHFNTMAESGKDTIMVTASTTSLNSEQQKLKACLALKEGFTYNNMMMVTVNAPSCWQLDNVIEARKNNPKVKRVEMDNDEINIYLNKAEAMCMELIMTRLCDIEKAHSGSVAVYAYYQSDDMRAEVDVSMQECKEDCGPGPSDHAASLTPLHGMLLTGAICLLLSLLMAT